MEKYLVFIVSLPEEGCILGGWDNFIGDFDTIGGALSSHNIDGYQVMQIVDRDTKIKIFSGDPAKYDKSDPALEGENPKSEI